MILTDAVMQISDFKLTLTPVPNALPANYRRSKAWRSHFLGCWKESAIKNNIFLIFVLDDKYGMCKYEMLDGVRSVSRRRKGKSYLRFQCNYPKDRITIFALNASLLKSRPNIFDEMHEGLLRLNEIVPEDFADLAVQCDDSFDVKGN